MRTLIGIHIAADAALVFELARDVSRWPTLLPHYRRVTVQAVRGDRTVAQMVALRRFGTLAVPVTWRAETWAEGSDSTDLRLRFRHIRGITRGMDVTWHIRQGAAGSEVVIEHDFRRSLPLVGDRFLPWIVDRWFTRPIASRTLATFKALAEADRVVSGVVATQT